MEKNTTRYIKYYKLYLLINKFKKKNIKQIKKLIHRKKKYIYI